MGKVAALKVDPVDWTKVVADGCIDFDPATAVCIDVSVAEGTDLVTECVAVV